MTATPQQPILGVGAIALPRPRWGVRRLRPWRLLSSLVLGAVTVGSVGLACALTVLPAVGGAHTLTVLSGSMAPTIPTGSVVTVRPVDPAAVQVGDVVTYAGSDPVSGANELITHRVVAIGTQGGAPVFTTKGDANRIADAQAVPASQVRGEVWYHIPWVGTVRDAVFTETGGLLTGALALLVVGLGLLSRIGRSVRAEDRVLDGAR